MALDYEYSDDEEEDPYSFNDDTQGEDNSWFTSGWGMDDDQDVGNSDSPDVEDDASSYFTSGYGSDDATSSTDDGWFSDEGWRQADEPFNINDFSTPTPNQQTAAIQSQPTQKPQAAAAYSPSGISEGYSLLPGGQPADRSSLSAPITYDDSAIIPAQPSTHVPTYSEGGEPATGEEFADMFRGLEAAGKWNNEPVGSGAPGISTSGGGSSVQVAGQVPAQSGEIESYIRQEAQKRGINPETAVAVARSEGGLEDPYRQSNAMYQGHREESYGPLQLHMEGGLGASALKEGIDPRKDWKSGVQFALDKVAEGGWGPWNGAKKIGITGKMGAENAKAIGVDRSQIGRAHV